MNSEEYIKLENKYGANNYKPLDVVIQKGEGAWVWDVEGKKYLDCLSAYSAVNQGHSHPKILKEFLEQASKLTLTSRAFRNDQLPLFIKEICDISGYEKFLPMNTGAEAVETAIKLARKWGYEKKGIKKHEAQILVCDNNFHGRTTTIVSFSSDELSKSAFGPYTPGFESISFGDIEALEKAITPDTCAFLVEPIQGEAGIVIPPKGYLKRAKEICEKKNVLFMVDEIQTGFGRTGELFAFCHEEIIPDVVIVGKALSGGFYPVSGVLSSAEVLGLFIPGEHGSTYGGNPLGCVAARAAMKVLFEDDLIKNSKELGRYFLNKLSSLTTSKINQIRGVGLFVAIELNESARSYCEKLQDEGLLAKDTHGNIIRIAPPLVVSKEEIEFAFKKIKKVLES